MGFTVFGPGNFVVRLKTSVVFSPAHLASKTSNKRESVSLLF